MRGEKGQAGSLPPTERNEDVGFLGAPFGALSERRPTKITRGQTRGSAARENRGQGDA